MKKFIFPILVILLLAGCKAKRDIVYLQDAGQRAVFIPSEIAPIPEPAIKIGDLLSITVNSNTPEAAQPFNLPIYPIPRSENAYNIGGSSGGISGGQGSLQNYLVDTEGKIIFPVIGKLYVAGLTKKQLSDLIKNSIYPRYINEEPIILIRYSGFKVTVLGEVARPGVFQVNNEKITILEALAQAGDITMFGLRDNILLIRENDGKRETIRLDIRDKNLLNSPYYFLQQDDVLYVQPNEVKINNTAFSSTLSIPVTVLGTLTSLTSLVLIMVNFASK